MIGRNMALWAALAALGAAQDDPLFSNSYKGKAPPEIVSEPGAWINASEPLRLEKLRGKVVWLEFGFLN
jgi:hypothetical protein